MKKVLSFVALIILLSTTAIAQKTFATRNGKITFIAVSDDDVKAVNNEVTSRLSDNGSLSFSCLIKGFRFANAEMQDHFNTEYMQSTQFPRADFKGAITNLIAINFAKDGIYKAVAKGNLTMHGVTKNITVDGTITIKAGKPTVTSKFTMIMKDFKIDASSVTDKVNAEINCVYQ
jgi:hypothetical protein